MLIATSLSGCDIKGGVVKDTSVTETESETEPVEIWQCRIPWYSELLRLKIIDTDVKPNSYDEVQGEVVWEMRNVPGDYKELGMQLTPPIKDEAGEICEAGEIWFTLERKSGYKVVYFVEKFGVYTRKNAVLIDLYEMQYRYLL